MTTGDIQEKQWDVLFLLSREDQGVGNELESIFDSLGLSVRRFESDGETTSAAEGERDNIDLARCVVILVSERSAGDRILHRLVKLSLNKANLIPITLDNSTLTNALTKVQAQRIGCLSSWDSLPDDGLYRFLRQLRVATEKDFDLAIPVHEHNKQAHQIYVKVDGQAYLYHGEGTTTWLQSEAFQRQRETERQRSEVEKAQLKHRHFVPDGKDQ